MIYSSYKSSRGGIVSSWAEACSQILLNPKSGKFSSTSSHSRTGGCSAGPWSPTRPWSPAGRCSPAWPPSPALPWPRAGPWTSSRLVDLFF